MAKSGILLVHLLMLVQYARAQPYNNLLDILLSKQTHCTCCSYKGTPYAIAGTPYDKGAYEKPSGHYTCPNSKGLWVNCNTECDFPVVCKCCGHLQPGEAEPDLCRVLKIPADGCPKCARDHGDPCRHCCRPETKQFVPKYCGDIREPCSAEWCRRG